MIKQTFFALPFAIAALLLGCAMPEEQEETSLMEGNQGKTEVLTEEMARSLMPATWTYYVREDGLKAECIHGQIRIEYMKDGEKVPYVQDHEGNYLNGADAGPLLAALLRDMQVRQLDEAIIHQMTEELIAAQDASDGYARPISDWLRDDGLTPFMAMLALMIAGPAVGTIGAIATISTSVPFFGEALGLGQYLLMTGTEGVWVGLVFYLTVKFSDDNRDPEGWIPLGSCADASCDMAPLLEVMM